MKRKIISAVAALVMVLTLCACGSAESWQEKYDLGQKYMDEGNYEQAVVAFSAAIKIDRKNPKAYVGRGDAYVQTGEYDKASADYDAAEKLDSTIDLSEKREALAAARDAKKLAALEEELKPAVAALDIPFSLDSVTVGSSGIDAAVSAFGGKTNAKHNLMNDETEDAVYVCFGLDTPIPAGYEKDEFGFVFLAPASGGAINMAESQDPSILCLGGLHVGDSAEMALKFFGLEKIEGLHGKFTCDASGGKRLSATSTTGENFGISYTANGIEANVHIESGIIHTVNIKMADA